MIRKFYILLFLDMRNKRYCGDSVYASHFCGYFCLGGFWGIWKIGVFYDWNRRKNRGYLKIKIMGKMRGFK